MSACFLDTSAVVDLSRNRTSAVAAASLYKKAFLSAVVWGEPVSGAYQAQDSVVELLRLERFLASSKVVGAGQETGAIYGELLADLERQGRRIPTNDLWIAATAVQFDLPLLARDGHFGRVPQLRWVSY